MPLLALKLMPRPLRPRSQRTRARTSQARKRKDLCTKECRGRNAVRLSALSAAARSALPPNVGGRPSKVSDKSLQELVRKTLEAYLKDSERVLVVGRGMNKKMVLAQHLTKKRNAIYNVESALSSAMSRETFRKVMKIHFPHVKNPRRLTDICASCRDQGIILFCFLVPPYFVTMSLQ